MSNAQLETAIEAAWEARDTITPSTGGETREAIEATLNALDSGKLRVAEQQEDGDWHVNQWAKKAVLLGFRIKDMEHPAGGPQGGGWWDKVDSKFKGWGDDQWNDAGFRAVPNCVVRKSAYIAPGVVLMPSFVNLGAYVDRARWSIHGPPSAAARRSARTCTCRAASASAACWNRCRQARPSSRTTALSARAPKWSKAASCAKARCWAWASSSASRPRSSTAKPARSCIGEVPPYSVVVAGSMPSKNNVNLYCAVIVKRVDAKTRSKTAINELLRD